MEDFYFFYDGDDEKDFNGSLNEFSEMSSFSKVPNQDSGGGVHKDPDSLQLQIDKPLVYEDINSISQSSSDASLVPQSLKKFKTHNQPQNSLNILNTQMIQFINLNRFYGQTCHKRKRVELDESGASFRTAFYNICGKSIFPKEYVQQLHDAVCSSIGLPPISRTERRSIRTYFKNYAKHKTIIINAIKEYLNCKQDLVNKICTPSKVKLAKKAC